MKRLSLILCAALFAALFIRADVAQADLGDGTNTVECCQLTTSLAHEAIRGKSLEGDERFFASEGAPPNIHFLIDNSGSMRELIQVKNSDETSFLNAEPLDPLWQGCT